MGWFSNAQQRQILRLEPSRGMSAIGHLLIFLVGGAFSAVAFVLVADVWPSSIEQPDLAGVSREVGVASAAVSAGSS